MPKAINDIRIGKLEVLAEEIRRLGGTPFLGWQFAYIASRYCRALLALDFRPGAGDVFILNLNFEKAHGVVQADWDGVCRVYSCGVDPQTLAFADNTVRQQFFINAVHAMMVSVATEENLSLAEIDWVRASLLAQGEQLEITAARTKSSEIELKVTYTVADPSHLTLHVCRLDSDFKIAIPLMVLDDYTDALRLVTRLTLNKQGVSIHPRQSDLGRDTLKRYWERFDSAGYHSGTSNFIKINLAELMQ